MVATILYLPLKGKDITMDEQDKTNTEPTVAETVHTDPAPPAEVTVEKEAEAAAPAEVTVAKEAAPYPTEVTEVTVHLTNSLFTILSNPQSNSIRVL